MYLINLIVNYLYRKYGVLIYNLLENRIRGISHLNHFTKLSNRYNGLLNPYNGPFNRYNGLPIT